MSAPFIGLSVLAVLGIVVTAVSLVVLRRTGARPDLARRLAGPPEAKVGSLLEGELPRRAVRVTGRIRCRDPLVLPDGDRLVALHRDIEVEARGRWRTVERLRETRSFELWDHDGSLTLDPAAAAEPLITIPHVWTGAANELDEPYRSAAARLAERHGAVGRARATTRSLAVTDRLLALARPVRDDAGRVRLEPPDGGYLISSLALPDAMRLLAGRHRRAAVAAVIGLLAGASLAAVGAVGALLVALSG